MPFVLVAVALVVGWLTTPGFLSPNHLSSLSQTAAYVGIIAIGETLVLLLGGIDLSLPYTINLAAILLAGFQANGMSSTHDILARAADRRRDRPRERCRASRCSASLRS